MIASADVISPGIQTPTCPVMGQPRAAESIGIFFIKRRQATCLVGEMWALAESRCKKFNPFWMHLSKRKVVSPHNGLCAWVAIHRHPTGRSDIGGHAITGSSR
jgi:hypothetical protein